MGRPQLLQRLKHDKLLTKTVFPFFVETWNWLIGRVDNIRGDKDENEALGYIRVDNTDDEAPVIRFEPPADFWDNKDGKSYYADSEVQALGQESLKKQIYEDEDDDDSDDNGKTYFQIAGFDEAEAGTSPVVTNDDETGNKTIEWKEIEGGGAKADGVSIDKKSNDELEIKGWSTASASGYLAAQLVSTSSTDNIICRNNGTLGYRGIGHFQSGSDSNVTFTTNGSEVNVNVYYV